MVSRLRPRTLVDILRWRGLNQPERRAYTFLVDGETEEVHMTYGELDRQARAIAATLQELKAEGERALLLYPPGLEYIAAFLGCLYAGVIAVPVYPPDPARLNRTLSRLRAIAKDSQVKLALTTQPILSMAELLFEQAADLKSLHWMATDTIEEDAEDYWKDPEVSGEDLAFFQYTSGATGSPKGVMLSHGNLLHNSAQIHRCFEHTSNSQGVIWLPPYHDMGLIGGILQPLYAGFPVALMSPLDILQRPVRWMQAITRYKGTTSGGPNFSYDLCVRKITREQKESLDLSSWNVAFCGAEPIRQETLDRFVEAFEPCGFRREAFYPCYGLAEGTLIVSGGRKADSPVVKNVQKEAFQKDQIVEASPGEESVQQLVGCGHSLQDQQIVIVNPETSTCCPSNQIGELWVSGPSVTPGYWNRPEETKETFQAYLKDTGEGPFLRTGDLGFLKDGELFVTGRLKDLIIIRGQNHYPQDIELTVEQSDPRLRPGCGAAFSIEVNREEHLVIVQEVDTRQPLNTDEVIAHIRQAVYDTHELRAHAVVLIEPRSIPKTSSGKIQRYTCRASFLEGSLAVVGEWNEQQEPRRPPEGALDPVFQTLVGSFVLKVLQEVLPARAVITANSSLALDLGLDSLATIEFWAALERAFGITIPEAERFELNEVGQVIAYLEARSEELCYAIPFSSQDVHNWVNILEDGDSAEAQRRARTALTAYRRARPIFLKVMRKFFKRVSKLRIQGLENLPAKGPYILAPNHQSHLDNLFVACFLPRWVQKNMAVIGKKEHFEHVLTRMFAKLCHAIPVDRSHVSSLVLQICAQLLKQGKILLVHPEGTRSPNGELQPFKNGVGLLASYVQCPIIPVYIEGAHEFWPKDSLLPKRRGHVSVVVGKPLYPLSRIVKGPQVIAQAEHLTSQLTKQMMSLQKAVNSVGAR